MRALLAPLVCCVACAGRSSQPPAVAGSPTSPAQNISVPRTVVTPERATSLEELYREAELERARGELARAVFLFDRIAALDPAGEWGPRALLRAAELSEQLGDRYGAVGRLEQVCRRYPGHESEVEALVRSVRLLAFLEQWDRAGRAAARVLEHTADLSPVQQVLAYGARGLGLLFGGDPEAAERVIEKGRSVIDQYQLDRAGRVPSDLAPLYFALGELRRWRAERIRFVPVPTNFGAVLEQRCQLLLDAQSAYSDVMRAYDAHWSAMAGYRVGELYQSLHEDLMRVPPPATADTPARRQLFEGAMRLRYAVLLQKAKAMMDHTLAMVERTGERSEWVLKTRDARATIEQQIDRENAALDALPYSRLELQAALDELAQRSRDAD